jgi:hypothetical protein
VKKENLPEKQFVLSICPTARLAIVKDKLGNIERYEIHNLKKTLAVSFESEQVAWSWAKSVINRYLIQKLNK